MSSSRLRGLTLATLAALVSGCGGGDSDSQALGARIAISSAVSQKDDATVVTMAEGTRFSRSWENFRNPERGEGGWADLIDASNNWYEQELAKGRTLLRAQVRLDDYLFSRLPESLIEQYQRGFDLIRKNGVKVSLRFVYNHIDGYFNTDTDRAADASLDRVIQHIAQLGPLVQKNRDVIAWVEAGFIGAWGEWHSSGSGLDSPEAKIQVRDALLQNFPADRKILVRLPADIQSWYPDSAAAQGRVGIHNDCVLITPTDASTWVGRGTREYGRSLTLSAPYGGEHCNLPRQQTDCASILEHGRHLRLTWLNFGPASATYRQAWQAGGCLDEVERSLGYRLELEEFQVSVTTAQPGETVSVAVRIRNLGWAPMYNQRPLQLVFSVDGRPVHRVDISGADLRQVQPEADMPDGYRVTAEVAIPENLSGRLELGLAAPDDLLRDDPRHAVRFANADQGEQRWFAESGFFRTGVSVQVR